MIREKVHNSIPVIDLTGPDGNAFSMMGFAQRFAKQLGYSQEAISELLNDMKSSDYEHLIKTFDNHFGDFVILER
jgi:uncharacterized alpha/beta hydrolase family protein